MFKPRPCGCKGVRTCLLCEQEFGISKRFQDSAISQPDEVGSDKVKEIVYEYCYLCDKAWTWNGLNVASSHSHHNHIQHTTDPPVIDFPGILLIPDFVTETEESSLVTGCDSIPWDLSQSGRRKQNFGPKTNFKKKKIKAGTFAGFPEFSRFAQEKLDDVPLLADFQTIEQCAIEYRPETGAHIDPHIDDCWVWGERVISLNLLSDSVLSMTPYQCQEPDKLRYNLEYYNERRPSTTATTTTPNIRTVVRVPMPRRSLLVLYGVARYEWEHAVLRADIQARRICLAYREFTAPYLPGGEEYETVGKDVLSRAKSFWEPTLTADNDTPRTNANANLTLEGQGLPQRV